MCEVHILLVGHMKRELCVGFLYVDEFGELSKVMAGTTRVN
jgi:hypothetical protein